MQPSFFTHLPLILGLSAYWGIVGFLGVKIGLCLADHVGEEVPNAHISCAKPPSNARLGYPMVSGLTLVFSIFFGTFFKCLRPILGTVTEFFFLFFQGAWKALGLHRPTGPYEAILLHFR